MNMLKRWSAEIARVIWLVLALSGTSLFVVALARAWPRMQDVCHPASACGTTTQLDPATALILTNHGLSPTDYAVFVVVAMSAVWLLWYGLAALIVWRKPDDAGALVAAFFLILFPQVSVSQLLGGPGGIIGISALLGFGLLFPDGRFVPRWTRWLALSIVAALLVSVLPVNIGGGGLWIVPTLILPMILAGLQIYRYRQMSSWAQRQRTKWAFLGVVVGIVCLVIFVLPGVFAVNDVQNGGIYAAVAAVGFAVSPAAIPIAIAIGVLRSRLWDIDRVIGRAMVYVSLTAALAGIYVGGVIGLQALFGLFIGNGSPAAIALSTLAIVALFGPLRRRIQIGIDRRFYRSKYDAARTLSVFGERLRDQVDLGHLSRDLTSVVHDTLHPEHVSLWLRDGGAG